MKKIFLILMVISVVSIAGALQMYDDFDDGGLDTFTKFFFFRDVACGAGSLWIEENGYAYQRCVTGGADNQAGLLIWPHANWSEQSFNITLNYSNGGDAARFFKIGWAIYAGAQTTEHPTDFTDIFSTTSGAATPTIVGWQPNSTGTNIYFNGVYQTRLGPKGDQAYPAISIHAGGSDEAILQIWNITSTTDISFPIAFGNATSRETEQIQFGTNLSLPVTATSATLFYNNSNQGSATVSAFNSTLTTITKTIDVPTGLSNTQFIPWYYQVTLSNGTTYNLRENRQHYSFINLTICGASPQNVRFVNFSFRNETTVQQNVTATLSSTWTYFLGSGAVNKTLSYSNAGEAASYSFCFAPVAPSLYTVPRISYSNAYSQQRTYAPGQLTYTNTTTNTTLFLLPTSDGSFVTFQVVTSAFQPISGATVNITHSTFGLIETSTTSDSGSVSFFLNPNVQYTVCGYKSGFGSLCSTDTFSQSSYSIILGGTTTQNQTQDLTRGVSWSIQPTTATLSNNTNQNFNFTFSSTYWDTTSFGFVLKNNLGQTLGSDTDSGNTGTSTVTINTGTNVTVTMNAFWLINGTYTNVSRTWVIINSADTEYSILNFFNRLAFYINSSDSDTDGIYGLENQAGNNFNIAILLFFVVFLSAGFISYKYGLSSPFAVMGFVFAFTFLLDVTFGLIPRPLNNYPIATIVIGVVLIGAGLREMSR